MTKINQVIHMELAFILIVWLALGAMTAYLANQKGRDPFLWSTGVLIISLFGLPFAVMAVAFLLFLPTVEEENELPEQGRQDVQSLPASAPKPFDEIFSHPWFFYDPAHLQQGPLTLQDMRVAWSKGDLTSDSYVWTEGFDGWKKAGSVPELVDALTGIPSETVQKM